MRWFDAMCGAFQPDLADGIGELPDDLAAAKSMATQSLNTRDKALGDALDAFDELPPPAIDKGAALDPVVTEMFGAQRSTIAKALAQVDQAPDAEEVKRRMGTAAADLEAATQRLAAFDTVLGAPALEQEMRKIPTCQALFGP